MGDACDTGIMGLTVRFVKALTDESFKISLGTVRASDVISPKYHPRPSAVDTLGHGGLNY